MQTSAGDLIDTHRLDFLSYGPLVGGQRLGMEDLLVPIDPELGGRLAGELALARPGFPLRPAKVQRPMLPEETLQRHRLLDWLEARADRRVIYVVAEAGFGKTTLVADYLRRSRLRAFWYRLDEDDTDGLVFIRYLVAACQAVDTSLLARASALLSESSLEPVSYEAALESVFGELNALGSLPSALVLDDFHTVESVPGVGSTVERLLARVPASLKIIVASRRTPNLSVAALRARGELAELSREDLRFDEAETGRLFSDSYHHPLEADVLHDLQARTDGWAASLQLVKTAVDGRSPGQVRAFVKSLSGAAGHLYDYLAEEVVGDLAPDLRDFLVRMAILEDIEPDTAAIAAEVSPAHAGRLLIAAQRLGLMSRGGDERSTWRFHPLVREFLQAHLETELGESGVGEMHRRLATVMESRSWRLAARHWAAAGDALEVRRVISAATPTIIGTGDLAAAEEFITRFPDPNPNPWFDIIKTRRLLGRGLFDLALVQARRMEPLLSICETSGDASLAVTTALTMLQVSIESGDQELQPSAIRVLMKSEDQELASIARATQAVGDASLQGSLDQLRDLLRETLDLNRKLRHSRYEAISLLNLSTTAWAMGDATAALSYGFEALTALGPHASAADVAAAHLNIAKPLAHLGRWSEARSQLSAAMEGQPEVINPEVVGEAAELEAMYGDPSRGAPIIDRVFSRQTRRLGDPYCRLVSARITLELGQPDEAADLLAEIDQRAWMPAFQSARQALTVQVRATADPHDPVLIAMIAVALRETSSQQAWFWWKSIRLTEALVSTEPALSGYLSSTEPEDAAHLSIQAELVTRRLHDLHDAGLDRVRGEASLRPERWRWALRAFLLGTDPRHPLGIKRAAELLEIVGNAEDLALLTKLRKTKALKLPDAGRALTRRLAPRIYVEDLGRVTVRVGHVVLDGTEIRKKVLSLFCYLLTRPQCTATRDQVLEALWPEMDPEAGANSLNQSAYFLRRILEPGYNDDRSAGYLRSRADLIWVDHELVTSRSSECLALIDAIRRDSSPGLVTRLAESYTGRFAVDFIYDDWASSYRDSLHASFLDRIERSVTADTKAGAFDRALYVAQLALQADPDAEQIELCLLRLYRRMGANAAAAEQYAHYSSVMREQLGVEPPPLETI